MNIVLLAPDNLPPDLRRAPGDLAEMMERFKTWDPVLQRFLGLVKNVDKWRLMHRALGKRRPSQRASPITAEYVYIQTLDLRLGITQQARL